MPSRHNANAMDNTSPPPPPHIRCPSVSLFHPPHVPRNSSGDNWPPCNAPASSSSHFQSSDEESETHRTINAPFLDNHGGERADRRGQPLREEEVVMKLGSRYEPQKEDGLRQLHVETRDVCHRRSELCTRRLLSYLLPFVESSNRDFQVHATATIVNLSLEQPNRRLLVLYGAVPKLLRALQSINPDARSNAAAALFALSMEASNKADIGKLGAIPLLVGLVENKYEKAGTRRDAALALHHLCASCEANAALLASRGGAARTLLGVAAGDGTGGLRKAALLAAVSLAECNEGRAALVEAGAVEEMLRMSWSADQGRLKLCVKVLHRLSVLGRSFWSAAEAAGAKEVLQLVWAREGEAGMENVAAVAGRMLEDMRSAVDESRSSEWPGGGGQPWNWTSANVAGNGGGMTGRRGRRTATSFV